MQIKIQPGVSDVDSDIFLTVFLYGSNLWKCHSPGKWTVLFDLPDIRTRFHDLKQDHRTDDRSDTGNGTADSHKPKSGIFYDHTTHSRTGCNTEVKENRDQRRSQVYTGRVIPGGDLQEMHLQR